MTASLRELFILDEDYVSMDAVEDEIDVALLNASCEAGAGDRQTAELAAQSDINHRGVSHKICRMNKRV